MAWAALLLPVLSPLQTMAPVAPFTTRTYGTSVKGAPLEVTRFGDHGPVTLIFFAIHGSERSTKPCGELLRKRLEQDPDLSKDTSVLLITCANPDGWAARTRGNANGVDLNRNFPDGWKAETMGRGNKYPGPISFSEPESRALAQLVLQESPDQVVSVHQPLVMNNYDGEYSIPLATAIAQANGYPLTSDTGSPTPGSFGHWCVTRKIPLVTLEMPSKDVETCWRENEMALVAAIRFGATLTRRTTKLQ